MCNTNEQINIKNPVAVLTLSFLNGTQPQTMLDLEEALDTILLNWSNDLADDEDERIKISSQIARVVFPYLEAC